MGTVVKRKESSESKRRAIQNYGVALHYRSELLHFLHSFPQLPSVAVGFNQSSSLRFGLITHYSLLPALLLLLLHQKATLHAPKDVLSDIWQRPRLDRMEDY